MSIFNVGFFLFQAEFTSSGLSICLPYIGAEIPFTPESEMAFTVAPLAFLGLGCIFWNPISTKVGKRPAMVAANAIFLGGTMLNLTATNNTIMLVSRLLQGFAASAPHGLGPACISDVSFLHERATRLGLYE